MGDTKDRLLRGARMIGQIFRDGKISKCGWTFDCQCEPKEKWCKAKSLWMDLAAESGRELMAGPFELVESFLSSEFEASGLTMVLEIEGIGQVKVGPKGEIPWKTFAESGGAESLKTVLLVLRKFTGSKVVK